MNKSIRILIVDDHTFVRLAIRRILQDVEGMKVIGEADSSEQALQIAKDLQPDVILMDVKMTGMGGLEGSKRLLRLLPTVKIIAVTAVKDDPFPSHLLNAGVKGYLTKDCSLEQMIDAIRKVMRGEIYIIPEVAQHMALKSLAIDHRPDSSPIEQLSERELQVMLMITAGSSVQHISEKLCLSSKTINSYRYRLFEKFNIHNDVQLTHIAFRHGLHDKSSFDDLIKPENKDKDK